jgi:predicted ATPase
MKLIFARRSSDYPIDKRDQLFLGIDNWNDYSFYTLFDIWYIDSNNEQIDFGKVRIARVGQMENENALDFGEYNKLPQGHFSLGAGPGYYEKLKTLGVKKKVEILTFLNDIAYNDDILKAVSSEQVFITSFLRSISIQTILGQYRRIAHGGVKLTPYHFIYQLSDGDEAGGFRALEVKVEPESFPSTNIHILIGKNGVGKTFLISRMVRDLLALNASNENYGKFMFQRKLGYDLPDTFANLICVSFSVFDDGNLLVESHSSLKYSYVGLKTRNVNGVIRVKENQEIDGELIESLKAIHEVNTVELLKKATKILERDAFFLESRILDTIFEGKTEDLKGEIINQFNSLSSGHKIVLLTIVHLVENLQEKSLVIIDEPETHLHPPLLSAFINVISDLLVETNGVALIATHSPVVLQEVPRSCVSKLSRIGTRTKFDRPGIETFGENVGILTHEVFKLEVLETGFYAALENAMKESGKDYERILSKANGQLGSEARALLMTEAFNNKNPKF